jgi:cation diffusion facilitator family transporter
MAKENSLPGAENREKVIVRTSIVGILANVFLAALKFTIGLVANSVAVISDAVNNLSDALSSVITIVGTKLAAKAPDKKHPMGYGRIEYLSALIVSAIVLYAGITAFVDSVKKIIHPEEVSYTIVSVVIIAAAVAVKLVLGAYVKKKGKEVNSGSLTASGEDASHDAILSASVLVSALIFMIFHVNLEAWVGALISVFIVKAGLEMISEAVDEMLGVRVSSELSGRIKETVNAVPGVQGTYDLLLNNYGPDRYIASLHVELDETMTVRELDGLTRRLQQEVYAATGVILATVGVYSVNAEDTEAARIREDVRSRVLAHPEVLQFHGFYADTEAKHMTFDVILDFAAEDRQTLYEAIREEVRAAWPDYEIRVTLDVDASD